MRNKYLLSVALAAIVAATAIRSLAQSADPASKPSPTNVMSGYIEAARKAVVSGTEATNLTGAEVGQLMNESIKTNLAAQLWFRQAMVGTTSAHGAQMAQTLRVLEALRAGRTDEALRLLENDLDSDIIVLATYLRASDNTKTFQPTAGPLKSLQWARDYRFKFTYKSGDPDTDASVKNGLSYPNQK